VAFTVKPKWTTKNEDRPDIWRYKLLNLFSKNRDGYERRCQTNGACLTRRGVKKGKKKKKRTTLNSLGINGRDINYPLLVKEKNERKKLRQGKMG